MLVLPALLGAVQAWADATHVDAEFSLRHDNNISRAEASRDQFSDKVAGLDLAASRSLMLTEHSGLQLRVGAHLREFARFDDLSHVSMDIGALYRIQPVKSYTAPWFEVAAGWERFRFQGSDFRDGDQWSLDLGVGKRITDKLKVRAGYGWEYRNAEEREVFEWHRRTLRLSADFRVTPALTLYGAAIRTAGDQVFTATPAPAFRSAAKAIVDDPTFGARRAYRLGAEADVLELGWSYQLNPSQTLDVGVRRFDIEADGDHRYGGAELRASWLYRFQ